MRYFDYTFYRIYSFFNKSKHTPNFTAILFLIVLQACVLFFVIMTINGVFGYAGSSAYLDKKQFWLSYWVMIATVVIIDIVRYAGKQRVGFYVSLFKGSRLNKAIPTWLILIQPLLFILLTILINVILKNKI